MIDRIMIAALKALVTPCWAGAMLGLVAVWLRVVLALWGGI